MNAPTNSIGKKTPEEGFTSIIRDRIDQAIACTAKLPAHATTFESMASAIHERFQNGGKLMTCGNGGSAAEALHFAEELTGRFARTRPPLPALCLNADPTALTCISNDFGFDQVFSRQCEAFGRSGDALMVFSTSGKSPNIVKVLESARQRGILTMGLLGFDGGEAEGLCDISFLSPGIDSAAIQECHQIAMHAICNCFEPTT
ncbi:MAG: phosphoheptose isomerase [Phycisphaerae bacterium]|nr:phosphoheptose isomerase [Phycisphaerae bacterium]